jgi:Flp pilus assembly protein TadD
MGLSDSAGDVERETATRGQIPDPYVHFQLAEAYLGEGLLDEAIRICRDGLAAHPGDMVGRAVLARALLDRGGLDEAEREFRCVLERAPANVSALRFLGEICARKGRAEEARGYYAQALHFELGEAGTPDRVTVVSGAREAGTAVHGDQPQGEHRDPLASPTLAALYASQGYTDVAKVIFSQVKHSSPEAWQGTTASLMQKLLVLREAARKRRRLSGPAA